MAGTRIGAMVIGIFNQGVNPAGVHSLLRYVATGVVILAPVYPTCAAVRNGRLHTQRQS